LSEWCDAGGSVEGRDRVDDREGDSEGGMTGWPQCYCAIDGPVTTGPYEGITTGPYEDITTGPYEDITTGSYEDNG
jgi:hypothetical protein